MIAKEILFIELKDESIVNQEEFMTIGQDLAAVFVDAGMCKSKTDFRRQVQSKAVKVHDRLITDQFARMAMTGNKVLIVERK